MARDRDTLDNVIRPDEFRLDPLRDPPHSTELEVALLGAIMVKPEAIDGVAGFLRSEHFYFPVHGRIYDACLDMREKGGIGNPVTLAGRFRDDPDLEKPGAISYLAHIVASAVTVINAPHYAREIVDFWGRRQVIDIASRTIEGAFDMRAGSYLGDVLDRGLAELDGVTEALRGDDQAQDSAGEIVAEAVEASEAAAREGGDLAGISTGISALDKESGGLFGGDLYVVAGRPGMGKSAFGTSIGVNIAQAELERARREDRPPRLVLKFSLEMSRAQNGQRLIAWRTRIPVVALRRGDLSPDQWRQVTAAEHWARSLPLRIDDAPRGYTAPGIVAAARRIHRKTPLIMVEIDYAQLIRGTGSGFARNREQEVAEASRMMKQLAKELDVPVVLQAQLSRKVEDRASKRPILSDLRESGAIEQDADAVWFLYRPAQILKDQRPDQHVNEVEFREWQEAMNACAGRAEVIVGKNRQGDTGSVSCHYDARAMRFCDLEDAPVETSSQSAFDLDSDQ